MDDIIATILQESILAGMFAGMLWWMTTRQERLLGMLSRRIDITNLLLVGLQKELLAHDLTVSGVNPSAGAEPDERARNALDKYDQIHRVFDSIEASLKQTSDGKL